MSLHLDEAGFDPNEPRDELGRWSAGAVDRQLSEVRKDIASRMGGIPRQSKADKARAKRWKNTVATAAELHAAARQTEPLLRRIVNGAAEAVGAQSNYGPNDAHAVKTTESLAGKIAERIKAKGGTYEDAVRSVGDAVRGTIIVDRPEQIPSAVHSLITSVHGAGGMIVFDNKFASWHLAGYGAVHGDAYLPTPGGGWIRSEIQVQLSSIVDGTAHSVKEQGERLYKQFSREHSISKMEYATKSRLLYLAALQKTLR